MRVPCTARRSNWLILKEINPEYSLERLVLKLNSNKLVTSRKELAHWKDLMLGKIEGKRRRGLTEHEMVGSHHQLNKHEFEQTPEDSEG